MMEFERDFELEIGSSMVKRKSNKFMLIWKIQGDEVTGGVAGSPLKYKNLVIFGCGDHYLYAVDINTGKMVWRFKASQLFIDARPSEENGIIYIGSYDGNVYAIDSKNGKEVWRFKTGGIVYASCVVDGGKVYFGSEDSYVYAVDSKTGKEIWRFRTGAEVGSAATVYNGLLYIGS
ncbi:MAG: PQQ-binding-like beta-propeller repeat protein, partial [Candidatus Aenigmarchaeota archaeon]|nr:PQQ-binding-like beta-propeller repeat protein [Candidatus Aenigmarchaeota archaeon]